LAGLASLVTSELVYVAAFMFLKKSSDKGSLDSCPSAIVVPMQLSLASLQLSAIERLAVLVDYTWNNTGVPSDPRDYQPTSEDVPVPYVDVAIFPLQ
jgi:hypothetical protein